LKAKQSELREFEEGESVFITQQAKFDITENNNNSSSSSAERAVDRMKNKEKCDAERPRRETK
jgi:hypothetical protein